MGAAEGAAWAGGAAVGESGLAAELLGRMGRPGGGVAGFGTAAATANASANSLLKGEDSGWGKVCIARRSPNPPTALEGVGSAGVGAAGWLPKAVGPHGFESAPTGAV